VVGAAGLLAYRVLASDGSRPSYGEYPFPHQRELPLASPQQEADAKAVIEHDAAVTRALGGAAWSYQELSVATRGGTPVGIFAVLYTPVGIPGAQEWLWPSCDGTALQAVGPDVAIPGIEVVADLESGKVVEMVPLAGTPSGDRLTIPDPRPACAG
jgi:hypothetical protein